MPTYDVFVRKLVSPRVEADSPEAAIEEAKGLNRASAGFSQQRSLADDPTFEWSAEETGPATE